MPTRPEWSISAEWILPGDGEPLRNAVMRGRGAVIEAVGELGRLAPTARHRDLGEVVVMPGLVNAHTQLELTGLAGRLPAGRPMPQWFFAMLRRRPTGPKQQAAVFDGVALALAAGTTALADTSHNHQSRTALAKTPIRKLCLAEVMGMGPTEAPAVERLAQRLVGSRQSARMKIGLAPHAPYSAGQSVYRRAVEIARSRNWPISTHLAQSEAERQYLLSGTGRFFKFLARMGLIDSSVPVHGVKPVEFARRAGLFDLRCILNHVNFIDDEELGILAGSGASVVYCPGASRFFGHAGHRYPEMIQAGINVAVGTDGLACNDSLSMLAEIRRLRQEGRVDNRTILRMATINGARAMGWDDKIGSLAPGKQADWIALPLPPDARDGLEAILTTESDVLQTVIAGRTVFRGVDPPAW